MIGGLSTETWTRRKCGQFRCAKCEQWHFQTVIGQVHCERCDPMARCQGCGDLRSPLRACPGCKLELCHSCLSHPCEQHTKKKNAAA